MSHVRTKYVYDLASRLETGEAKLQREAGGRRARGMAVCRRLRQQRPQLPARSSRGASPCFDTLRFPSHTGRLSPTRAKPFLPSSSSTVGPCPRVVLPSPRKAAHPAPPAPLLEACPRPPPHISAYIFLPKISRLGLRLSESVSHSQSVFRVQSHVSLTLSSPLI